MKNQIQNHNTYSDPKITAQITEHNLLGQSKSILLAKTHLLSGMPPLTGGTLKAFIEPITNWYNQGLADLNTALESKLQIQIGSSLREENLNKNKDIQHEIADEESKLEVTKPLSLTRMILTIIAFVLIIALCSAVFTGDWVYLSRSLQVMTNSLRDSNLLGLAIIVGLLSVTHLSENYIISRITSRILRIISRIFVFVLVASTFIILGIARQSFASESREEDIPIIIFVGINLLLFVALFLLIDRVLIPMAPQLIETIKEFNQKVRNNRRLRKIKKLKDKLIQNRQDLSETLTQKLSQIAFHRSSELKIESNYYQAVSSYKELIIKGSIDAIPECLNDETPKLKMYTEDLDPQNQKP